VKSLSVSNCSPWQINLQSQNLPPVAVDTSDASPFLEALDRLPDPLSSRLTSYRKCPIEIRGLVAIVQAPVQNWTDMRIRRFYHDVQGKSEENFLLQLAGGHGNHGATRERI
jgi:hypothetical protein